MFSREVTQAKFYYLDKFVLLVTGNRLGLYKYYIGDGHSDDIKRSDRLTACVYMRTHAFNNRANIYIITLRST